MAETCELGPDDVPEEIEEHCVDCHLALTGVERTTKPVFAFNMSNMEEKMDKFDAASFILLLTYTMNSLFWVYTKVHGVDPKAHGIKKELERIKKYMQRIQNTSLQKKEPDSDSKVNADAAKRFIRNALFEEGEPTRKRGAASDETILLKKTKTV